VKLIYFRKKQVISPSNDLTSKGHNVAIRAGCFSSKGTYFVTSGEDKLIKCWKVSDWSLLKEWTAEKRVMEICVTDNESTIVAADKHGDVWMYATLFVKSPLFQA
jgi:WD40 repeat protein